MKIAMIYPNRLWDDKTNYQLGLAMLTTILQRAGHDARYYVYYSTKDLKEIQDFKPDVCGYYFLEFQADVIRSIIDAVPSYHIAGGPYPTLRPECINELPLDAVFRGEADRGLLRFIESGLKDTSIPGFVFKDKVNPVDDQLRSDELDKLPIVIREPFTTRLLQRDAIKRWESAAKGAIHFSAGRGCPFSCKFCANAVYNKLWKPSVRLRNVDLLIHEIRSVSEQYKYGAVVFTDDIVTVDEKWFEQFILQYIVKIKEKYNKTLILNTRVDCVTKQQMQLLKDAKCVLLRAGIESGSDKVRKLMGRPMTREDIKAKFCEMIDAGLRTYSYNLLGFPGETIEDWKETYDLNVEIANYSKKYAHLGMINVFYPYKGTPVGDECYSNNWVDTTRFAHPHYDYILKTPFMTEEQVIEIRNSWPFNHGG